MYHSAPDASLVGKNLCISQEAVNVPLARLSKGLDILFLRTRRVRQTTDAPRDAHQQHAHPLELLLDLPVPRDEILLDTRTTLARTQGLDRVADPTEVLDTLSQLSALLVEGDQSFDVVGVALGVFGVLLGDFIGDPCSGKGINGILVNWKRSATSLGESQVGAEVVGCT